MKKRDPKTGRFIGKPPVKKKCEECGEEFIRYQSEMQGESQGRFCSISCAKRHWAKNKNEKKWHVGMPLRDEHKKKLSKHMKKNNPAKDPGVAKKISKSNKGKTAWNKGKIEWVECANCGEKIRKWRKYCSRECYVEDVNPAKFLKEYTEENGGSWNKGKEMSDEFKEKCSRAHRRKWNNDEEYRKMAVKNLLGYLQKRPTSLEKKMTRIIKKHKLPYKYTGDGDFWIGGKNPDFIHADGEKKLIEVGNEYHHQGNYEKERRGHFAEYGWESFIFIGDVLDENSIVTSLMKGGE